MNPMMDAILKWSLTHSDGTSATTAQPMSEERKAWLQKAMKEMVVDPIEKMKEIIVILKKEDPPRQASNATAATPAAVPSATATAATPMANTAEQRVSAVVTSPLEEQVATAAVQSEFARAATAPMDHDDGDDDGDEKDEPLPALVTQKEQALDQLEDFVGVIDLARDLHKIGGFVPLIQTMRSAWPSLRQRAAQVFGVVVQNNPLCQDWALELHGLTTVIGLLAPHEEPAVVKSGLFALASLVKGHSTATEKFLHADGLQLLTNLLSYPRSTSSIQIKTINLLQYLWVHGASSTVPSLAVQVILLSKLEHDDVVLREAVIRALTMCLQRSAHSAQQRSDSEIVKRLQLRHKAIQALTSQEDRDQCQDELTLIEEALAQPSTS